VVTWTTEYYGLAIAQMRAEGRAIDDELLAHISPAHSENVNFFGTINVEVDTKLDPAGYRPLQPRRPGRARGAREGKSSMTVGNGGAEQWYCPQGNRWFDATVWETEVEDEPGFKQTWHSCPNGHGFSGRTVYAFCDSETRARTASA
jgi:hypothetical protein